MTDPNLICTFLVFCVLGAAEKTSCETHETPQFTTHIAFTPGQEIANMWTADLTVPPSPALVSMPFNALNSLLPGWEKDRPDLKHLGEGGVITFHALPGIAYSSITLGLETATGDAMISIFPQRIGAMGENSFPGFMGHGTCQPFEKEG